MSLLFYHLFPYSETYPTSQCFPVSKILDTIFFTY